MPATVTAHQKYLRLTPRKLRLVSESLKGLSVDKALLKLRFTEKGAAPVVRKVLIQAQQNAVNNSNLNPTTLKLTGVRVDEGPTYKRWQPVSRGRAHPIMKRTSHLAITVMGDLNTPKVQTPPAKGGKKTTKKEQNGTKS